MNFLLDSLSKRLTSFWRTREAPRRGRAYRCSCERPVFFRNSQCLACGAPLGYEPARSLVVAIEPAADAGTWKLTGENDGALFRRCANLETAAGCNWLVAADDPLPQCISCRLTRTVADQTDPDNQRYWRAIENAKRRLVSQLIGLSLPVKSKVNEDPERGVMFDLLRSPPEGPRVLTGHASGLITLNMEEADDALREKMRQEMNEPYRTLLGHFRHEIGHYYWDRLIDGTEWLPRFRELFGDERADYAAALQANYENGPPPDWRDRCISSYASVHPWEDWAESWAHYLHLIDSLDTAMGFGLSGDDVETNVEPFKLEDMYSPNHADAPRALAIVNSWLDLVTVLNELARSMGQPDFYPFVMSKPVLRKMHLIHLVVRGESPESVPLPAAE